jgi:hypothetical protein
VKPGVAEGSCRKHHEPCPLRREIWQAGTDPRKFKDYFGGKGQALGAAAVLMLIFMGTTLPGPLYLIYRDLSTAISFTSRK